MQNLIENFRRSSIVFEKLGIFSEKLKTLMSSNFAKILQTFPSYHCLQKCVRDFFIYLDLVLLRKLVSVSVQKPGLFQFLKITQDLKIPNTLL